MQNGRRSTTRRLREPTKTGWRRLEDDAEPTLHDEPAAPEPTPARVDRYEIQGVLGRGGMATVFRAFDPARGQVVALKVLRGGREPGGKRAERFRREVALGRRVAHPAFLVPLDAGEADGRAFFTMELAEGPTLDEAVTRGGPFGVAQAVELTARLARAVDALHRLGIVHRDLKPANIILHPSRGPLVLDLGLAKDLLAARPITDRYEVLGTVSFMAPEQVGGRVDPRTDVWALGAILHTLVTGRPPMSGAVARRYRRVPTARLAPAVPQLDPTLRSVLLAALARDPRHRPATAGDLAALLERVGA